MAEREGSGEEAKTFGIPAVEHVVDKFSAIDFGTVIQECPISVVPPGVMAPPAEVEIAGYYVIEQQMVGYVARIVWTPEIWQSPTSSFGSAVKMGDFPFPTGSARQRPPLNRRHRGRRREQHGVIEAQVLVAADRFAILDPNGTQVALPGTRFRGTGGCCFLAACWASVSGS